MTMPNLSSDVSTVHWVPRYAVNFSTYVNVRMYIISIFMIVYQFMYRYIIFCTFMI